MVKSEEFFEKLEARLAAIDPNNRKILHVYKFIITDETGKVLKSWILDLIQVKVYESTTDEAEVTLTLNDSILDDITTKKIVLAKALEDGLAKVEGNGELLTLLKEHFIEI